MLGVLKRKWKPKRATSSNGHHHNNNQNGRLLETPAASVDSRNAPSARQIHPLYGEKAQLLAYEHGHDALHHHLHAAVAVAAVTKPEPPLPPPPPPPPAPPYLSIPPPPPAPPAYPLAPNICVEGGRIEFIRPPLDGGGGPGDEHHPARTTPQQPHPQRAPPIPPHGVPRAGSIAGTVSRAQQTLPLDAGAALAEEKCDLAKESLEARVSELETLLESERKSCARERSAVQRLQRQLAKREAARRDVDRERYLRLDSAAEAEQCKARLAGLQRDLARMEEALRCMLQYKTRCSQLKQDKAALAAAYEARVQQCQATISKLSQENEALKKQVKGLEAQQGGGAALQQALLDRLRALEADNRLLCSDVEQQRRQYERCLDDVANQVVRALLSQKGLREEIGALQQRIRELETQNRALTSLLLQQIHNGDQDLKHLTPGEAPTPGQVAEDAMVTLSKPRLRRPAARLQPSPTCGPPGHPGPPGCQHADDPAATILAAVASIDPSLWLQVVRPQSLHLAPSLEGAQETAAGALRDSVGSDQDLSGWQQGSKPVAAAPGGDTSTAASRTDPEEAADAAVAAMEVEAVVEEDQDGSSSPESGNRDEGYSTMSSDVQGEASSRLVDVQPSSLGPGLGPATELEDVKEEAEQAVPEVASSEVAAEKGPPPASCGGRLLLLDLKALSARHSFPPARDLQVVLRNSFSDSHLCLSRLLHHAAASLASSPASCPAPLAPPAPLGKPHPLRRARATPSLLPSTGAAAAAGAAALLHLVSEADEEEPGASDWWDGEYVQHWLRLDETRSALQQRHREALELEYDHAELEDWSLSLSSEELDLPPPPAWRRQVGAACSAACGAHAEGQLPRIQENNNSVELEEDASECLWNNASYLQTPSPGAAGVHVGGGGVGVASGAGPGPVAAGWPYALPLADAADAMMSSLAVNAAGSSPGGSWSSSAAASATSDCYDCCLNGCHGEEGSSKRSSAALSGCSEESAATSASHEPGSPAVGTDFTHDFYRLVKFESTKSLASNSSSRHSRGQQGDNINNNLPASLDREQALQSVLKFIAEQQKYCHSREEQDSATELVGGGSRPVSCAYSVEEPPPPPQQQHPVEAVGEELRPAESTESTEPAWSTGDQDGGLDGEPCDSRGLDSTSTVPAPGDPEQHHEEEDVLARSEAPSDAPQSAASAAPLETVPEDEVLYTAPPARRPTRDSASPPPTTATHRVPSVLVCDVNDKAVSFHESASSKDVIDELNRMIRKGEVDTDGEEVISPAVTLPGAALTAGARAGLGGDDAAVASASTTTSSSGFDGSALCCPTGWVHVERDIDFTDPKARANLLDVMLASSGSSGSMSSSGSESGDCDGEDLPGDYRHLHRLHRFRRHKKASAFREPLGVLRFPSSSVRPSIIGRDDFFVRYGDKEREAMASFDFLDDMSTASISCASGASSTLGSLQRLDAIADLAEDERGTPTPQNGVDNAASEDSDERTGGQLSLSDSCGNSLSGSRSSLEDH